MAFAKAPKPRLHGEIVSTEKSLVSPPGLLPSFLTCHLFIQPGPLKNNHSPSAVILYRQVTILSRAALSSSNPPIPLFDLKFDGVPTHVHGLRVRPAISLLRRIFCLRRRRWWVRLIQQRDVHPTTV